MELTVINKTKHKGFPPGTFLLKKEKNGDLKIIIKKKALPRIKQFAINVR